MNEPSLQISDILKSQRSAILSCRITLPHIDFRAEFFASQLAPKRTVYKGCRADSWEFLYTITVELTFENFWPASSASTPSPTTFHARATPPSLCAPTIFTLKANSLASALLSSWSPKIKNVYKFCSHCTHAFEYIVKLIERILTQGNTTRFCNTLQHFTTNCLYYIDSQLKWQQYTCFTQAETGC